MARYNLNLSHNNINEQITYSEAIDLLNNYQKHKVGQPLVIIYYENQKRKMLFAVGKRNYTDPIDGRINGEEFYEIINKNNIGESSQVMVLINGELYIQGIDYSNNPTNYKLLNEKHVESQTNSTDIITKGYLDAWSTFQNIE